MSTCRVCHKDEGKMFKYSTRHYAHGRCGLNKWGAEFLNMIPAHEIGELPYFALHDAGLVKEAERRAKAAA